MHFHWTHRHVEAGVDSEHQDSPKTISYSISYVGSGFKNLPSKCVLCTTQLTSKRYWPPVSRKL